MVLNKHIETGLVLIAGLDPVLVLVVHTEPEVCLYLWTVNQTQLVL